MAAYRNRRSRRSGYAFEAIKLNGSTLFTGGASCGPHYLAIQDAFGEAILMAKELGFSRILTLSNSTRRLKQVCNWSRNPSWQEQTPISALNQLQQQGMVTHIFFVPKTMILHVLDLATITTSFLVHHCRISPNSIKAGWLYFVLIPYDQCMFIWCVYIYIYIYI